MMMKILAKIEQPMCGKELHRQRQSLKILASDDAFVIR